MRNFHELEVPNDPAQLPGFLRDLQRAMVEAAQKAEPFAELQVLSEEPSRRRNGMEVEADGTNWDPGSGAGKYVYRSGAWVFIG
jgi:hypothetical protein